MIYQTIIPISSLLTYSYPVFHAFLPRIIKPGYNYRIITLSRRLPIILSILSPIISPFEHAFITFKKREQKRRVTNQLKIIHFQCTITLSLERYSLIAARFAMILFLHFVIPLRELGKIFPKKINYLITSDNNYLKITL